MFAANQGLNQVTQPGWSITGTEVLSYLSTCGNNGGVALTSIPNLLPASTAGYYPYRAGCFHPNGNIYCPPYNTTGNICVINTQTNTVSYPSFGLSGLTAATNKWTDRGTYSPLTGLIYFVPYSTSGVLVIDPIAQTSSIQTWGLTFSGSDQYYASVLGNDNKIYAVGNATGANVLIIDPVANTAVKTTFSGTWTAVTNGRIGGLKSAKNGKLYFAPYGASAFFVIDTTTSTGNGSTSTASTQTFGQTWSSGQQFQGCAQVADGNILAFGSNAINVYKLNPVGNTASVFTTGSTKVIGPVTGTDGRVYGQNYTGSGFYIYDPVANTVVSTNISGNSVSGQWTGSAVGGDRAYFLPDQNAANAAIRILTFNGTGNLNPPLLNTVQSSPGFTSGP